MVLVLPPTTEARTWYVEKNGTGDFSVIQHAVDAAASGDTIRIGAGRFDDGELITLPGWSEFVRVIIRQPELTLIGAGPDQTFIGREEAWNLSRHGWDKGIGIAYYWNSDRLTVRDLAFTNTRDGIYSEGCSAIDLEGCLFIGNQLALSSIDDGSIRVSRCSFFPAGDLSLGVSIWNGDSLFVDESVFELGQQGSRAVSLQNCSKAIVSNSDIYDGSSGINLVGLVDLSATDIDFEDQSLYGISTGGSGVTIRVENCRFRGANTGITVISRTGTTIVEGSLFEDMDDASIQYERLYEGYIRNCLLAKGARFVVQDVSSYHDPYDDPLHFDMRDNWWGTTDADSINAWIEDHGDDPENPYIFDFEPFKDQPVASEAESFGGMKAKFLLRK